jgi:hypothetical protein
MSTKEAAHVVAQFRALAAEALGSVPDGLAASIALVTERLRLEGPPVPAADATPRAPAAGETQEPASVSALLRREMLERYPIVGPLRGQAEWLHRVCAEHALTPNMIAEVGGPHRRTVIAMLQGKQGGGNPRRKLADALRVFRVPVDVSDIPRMVVPDPLITPRADHKDNP